MVLQTAAADVDVGEIESRITTFINERRPTPRGAGRLPGPRRGEAGKDFFLVYEYTSFPITKGNGNATSVP